MTLEYPRASAQSEGSGDEYYYFSYNSNGTYANNNNPWMVIRAGTLKPTGGTLQVDFDDDESKSELKAAIILRRSGTTTPVLDPAEIN